MSWLDEYVGGAPVKIWLLCVIGVASAVWLMLSINRPTPLWLPMAHQPCTSTVSVEQHERAPEAIRSSRK